MLGLAEPRVKSFLFETCRAATESTSLTNHRVVFIMVRSAHTPSLPYILLFSLSDRPYRLYMSVFMPFLFIIQKIIFPHDLERIERCQKR